MALHRWCYVLVAGCLVVIACTGGGPSGEALWKQACDFGPIPADAPADLRALAYAEVIECRDVFAQMGASDGPTTDAIARCVIQLRDRDLPDEGDVIACVPEDRRDAARALLDQALAHRRRLAQPVPEPEPEPEPAPRGEELLAAEPVRGRELALRVCGDPPVRARPIEDYVRASMWRDRCRDVVDQLVRNDLRAAELIAACVPEIYETPALPKRPSAEQLQRCVPFDDHERVTKLVDDAQWWTRHDPRDIAELTKALEAELAASTLSED